MVICKPGELDWNYSFIICAQALNFLEASCHGTQKYLSKSQSRAPQRARHFPHLDNYEQFFRTLAHIFLWESEAKLLQVLPLKPGGKPRNESTPQWDWHAVLFWVEVLRQLDEDF